MAKSPRSSYFRDDITLTPEPTRDKWGATTTAGTPVTIKGRIDYKYRRVTDNNGNEAISNASVEIDDRDLDMDDKLTFGGTAHPIISWQVLRDAGFKYLRVFVR